MKKTVSMEHSKIKYPRMIEGAKNDIRKYIKRERRKKLPEGVDYWDFDCRFGDVEADAKVIHLTEINGCIDDVAKRELMSFYVEILAKEGVRNKPEKKGGKSDVPQPDLPKLKGFSEE